MRCELHFLIDAVGMGEQWDLQGTLLIVNIANVQCMWISQRFRNGKKIRHLYGVKYNSSMSKNLSASEWQSMNSTNYQYCRTESK